ncbi:hypothetical protein KCP76_11920 [Salmonella enterica subsp. enterica serovar Weltevreden]|nr:hypothetical protein KCP76_11920 [Salmonella enterica subsp. enterica serovar Weltevreden]
MGMAITTISTSGKTGFEEISPCLIIGIRSLNDGSSLSLAEDDVSTGFEGNSNPYHRRVLKCRSVMVLSRTLARVSSSEHWFVGCP